MNIFSLIRRLKLNIQTFIHGGKITCRSNTNIFHSVIFQGRGELEIDEDVTFGYWLGGSNSIPILLQPREESSKITIGKGTIINNGCELVSCTSIRIGEDCLIGSRTLIYDSDFHGISTTQRKSAGLSSPIIIEDNVWIGASVIVLKGVKVGKDAVVGAGCVVSKDVPAGTIAVGNPIRFIGTVYA